MVPVFSSQPAGCLLLSGPCHASKCCHAAFLTLWGTTVHPLTLVVWLACTFSAEANQMAMTLLLCLSNFQDSWPLGGGGMLFLFQTTLVIPVIKDRFVFWKYDAIIACMVLILVNLSVYCCWFCLMPICVRRWGPRLGKEGGGGGGSEV